MRLRDGCNTRQLLRLLGEALHKEAHQWTPRTYNHNNPKAGEVSPQSRDQTVKFIQNLNDKFHFYPETLFLSTAILDKVLSGVKAQPKYLKCIGVACFYLAAKTLEEDEVLPGTLELVQESECGCSVAEVLRMERCILGKLGWDLRAVTPLDFLHIFHALLLSNCPHLLDPFLRMSPSRQLGLLTHKLEACLSCHQLQRYSPSTQALSLLSLELEICAPDWLSLTFAMQNMVQLESDDLIRCREQISHYFSQSREHTHLTSMFVYVPKVVANGKVKGNSKPIKRKVDADRNDDDDNIYDGIKRLYNEDGSEGTQKAVTMATCVGEARHDDPASLLHQTLAN